MLPHTSYKGGNVIAELKKAMQQMISPDTSNSQGMYLFIGTYREGRMRERETESE